MHGKLSQLAVMNVDEGEAIVGGWATPHIPEVGIYKLLIKKRKDGKFEWAHFVQRDNGVKERVMRGVTERQDQIESLIESVNRNLKRLFGVSMQAAQYSYYTLDGREIPATKQ